MKKTLITLLIFLSAVYSLQAQDIAADLAMIREAYLANEKFSMDVQVTIFRDKGDKKGSFLGKGVIQKSKEKYYSKFMSDEMICNDKGTIIIDHSSKDIVYYKGNLSQKQGHDIDMSKLTGHSDSVRYAGMDGGMKHFVFYNKRADVVETHVYSDPSTHFVKKIVYIYRDPTPEANYDAYKVLIEYSNIRKDVNANVFNEKNYLSSRNGHPALLPAYSKYKLTVAEKDEL